MKRKERTNFKELKYVNETINIYDYFCEQYIGSNGKSEAIEIDYLDIKDIWAVEGIPVNGIDTLRIILRKCGKKLIVSNFPEKWLLNDGLVPAEDIIPPKNKITEFDESIDESMGNRKHFKPQKKLLDLLNLF